MNHYEHTPIKFLSLWIYIFNVKNILKQYTRHFLQTRYIGLLSRDGYARGRDAKLRVTLRFQQMLRQKHNTLKEELHPCMQALCMQVTMVTYKRERDP